MGRTPGGEGQFERAGYLVEEMRRSRFTDAYNEVCSKDEIRKIEKGYGQEDDAIL